MNAPIPQNLRDVLQRMVQLQYASRLKVDETFFDRIDRFVDLMAEVDAAPPEGSDIRNNPTHRTMRAHRKINHFNLVTSSLPPELSNASDFSRRSVETRIHAGYEDAVAQGMGRWDSPGLRSGTTGAGGDGRR